MKFRIERKTLLAAMTAANSVVERTNTIPVLSNVLIDAQGSILRFTATDLDMEISLSVAAEVESSGQITVPSSMFHDITKKLPDGAQVECETTESRFSVKTGRSKFNLQSLPAEDFPDLSSGAMEKTFVMDAGGFRRLFAKCLFAVSTEETRYYLNGVYLHEAAGTIRGVATDGHRLSMAWADLPEGAAGLPGVIVPRKMCGLIVKHLDGFQGDVRVGVSASKLMIEFGGTRITSKLIDGTFPDYDRVVPKGNNNVMLVDVKTAMAAVDRISTVSNEKGRAARFTVTDNQMEIAMNSPDSGSGEEAIDVGHDGPEIEIGFNSRYMMDVLANMGCERVRVEMADAGSPAMIKPEDGDMNFLAVVMPMRI